MTREEYDDFKILEGAHRCDRESQRAHNNTECFLGECTCSLCEEFWHWHVWGFAWAWARKQEAEAGARSPT